MLLEERLMKSSERCPLNTHTPSRHPCARVLALPWFESLTRRISSPTRNAVIYIKKGDPVRFELTFKYFKSFLADGIFRVFRVSTMSARKFQFRLPSPSHCNYLIVYIYFFGRSSKSNMSKKSDSFQGTQINSTAHFFSGTSPLFLLQLLYLFDILQTARTFALMMGKQNRVSWSYS